MIHDGDMDDAFALAEVCLAAVAQDADYVELLAEQTGMPLTMWIASWNCSLPRRADQVPPYPSEAVLVIRDCFSPSSDVHAVGILK